MPIEQVKFFCAHPQLMGECFNQCSMCERKERELKMAKEQSKFLCFKREDIHCSHQCYMCKDKEMKMAEEQPMYVMIITFNDRKPEYIIYSNTEETLVDKSTNLLRDDSTVQYIRIYKPLSKIQRAEYSITLY